MMSEMKLLLVEDQEQDQSLCQNAVADLNEEAGLAVSLEVKSSVHDALVALAESHYDGAIIDMKLAGAGDEGNQILAGMVETFRRIPVVIMTGTPDPATREGLPLVMLCRKGENTYAEIVSKLWGIYRTGLTKIMGGRGEIEKNLSEIFINNILPQTERWISYGEEDSLRTEKALLRHALNHLVQILDNDVDSCYPEEFYIHPPISQRINTGSIVKSKSSEAMFIVMNPACDLAERGGGGCNTDRALLAEIQGLSEIFPDFPWASPTRANIKELNKVYKNQRAGYYHWLPATIFFSGGVINFRRISTHTGDELDEAFFPPETQVSPAFLKDIVSRFSSYYARQGQPDIDHEKILRHPS